MSVMVLDATRLESFLPLAALIVVNIAAAWLDLRHRRLPNWLCVVTAAFGLLAAALYDETGLAMIGSHLLHALIALLIGMILFQIRVFGGGDAKFYAAIATWFPLADAVRLLAMTAFCGLALLIGWFTYRRLKGYPIRKNGGDPFDGLPYGMAIGAGGLAAMLV